MRVLSSTEVKELKGIEDVPIELRHCYFPVALRAYMDRPLDKSHIHKDQIFTALEYARSSLDIIVLRSDPSMYRDWRGISQTTINEFEFGKHSQERSFISAYGLFPTSHLISHE